MSTTTPLVPTSDGTEPETVRTDLSIILLANVRDVAELINERVRLAMADDTEIETPSLPAEN
jgi:hypothetical protein